ncbi:hypothetical protein [Nocardioides zhouii]|uniref:Uncharacterized protein n=1 Tax=Nocardioides zhouii TaxID=1168729 RepID=A0A4Q2TC28_9ACTN|nr:hypothetical protein [Nocardioides zhouii]RYC14764.1 hypothetical protein EUA94_01175 [Nocardioides zhouii]
MTITEDRLRAALAARAELVRPEDLAPLATVVPLRPRWQSPWVLLATAAVVLLILGVVLQGVGGRERSDRLAPEPDPDAPTIELPADVGRDWKTNDLSTPARLDLDGDGAKEKVVFLGEPTDTFDGRTRMQTTLSSTGEEAYGIAELGTTIGTVALPPIDADGDGDQELVLYRDELFSGPVQGNHPIVFDLRDGLLVQAPVESADLLLRGEVPVPGTAAEFYDMVRPHDYWIEEGKLFSARSVNEFASDTMTTMRPETYVMDAWEWVLGEDGVLRPVEAGCRAQGLESFVVCAPGQVDDLPVVTPVANETIGVGEQAEYADGYGFSARLEAVADPSLVVEGDDGRTVNHGLEVGDPQVNVQAPTDLFFDGASLVLTSGSDPSYIQVLVQDGNRMRALEPVGEITLVDEGPTRTWLTRNGALVTVVLQEDASWQAWKWVMVSRTEMAAFPTGTVCFYDVEVQSTVGSC